MIMAMLKLTLRLPANNLAEVAGLTICPLRVFQHAREEPELTEQAMFDLARRSDVGLGVRTERNDVE